MTSTTIILVNLFLSLLTLAAVGGLTLLAHRLPGVVSHHDEGSDGPSAFHVPSGPLPLAEIARDDAERASVIPA